jgi:hypothetical protein
LLERLREISKDHDFVHVEDDIQTNAAFLGGSRAVYYEGEGSNILVKVRGMDDVAESWSFVDVKMVKFMIRRWGAVLCPFRFRLNSPRSH